VRLVLAGSRAAFSCRSRALLQAARTPFLIPMKAAYDRTRSAQGPHPARCGFFQQMRGRPGIVILARVERTRTNGRPCSLRLVAGTPPAEAKVFGGMARVLCYLGFRPCSIRDSTDYRRRSASRPLSPMERARIRTTTLDPLRAVFFFVRIALLLLNAWVWLHLMAGSASRQCAFLTLHLDCSACTTCAATTHTFADHSSVSTP